jgi:hypothetical protein
VRHRLFRAIVLSALVGSVAGAVGCVFLGEAPLRRLDLRVSRVEGGLDFAASDAFEGIACGIYDVERARRLAPDVIRATIWRARCPGDAPCVRSARYGDPMLRTEVPPVPLTGSLPGECYRCGVGGRRGRGEVLFRLDPHGAIEPCPGGP